MLSVVANLPSKEVLSVHQQVHRTGGELAHPQGMVAGDLPAQQQQRQRLVAAVAAGTGEVDPMRPQAVDEVAGDLEREGIEVGTLKTETGIRTGVCLRLEVGVILHPHPVVVGMVGTGDRDHVREDANIHLLVGGIRGTS
jgi:hypothetical protein